MKILRSITALFLVLTIISCNGDDDRSNLVTPELVASWKLVRVSGGIAGINQDMTQENIVWEFHNDGTVNIENGATGSNFTGIASGNYDYEFVSGGASGLCPEILKIDVYELGCVTLDDNNLYISNNFVDGFTLEFEPALQGL